MKALIKSKLANNPKETTSMLLSLFLNIEVGYKPDLSRLIFSFCLILFSFQLSLVLFFISKLCVFVFILKVYVLLTIYWVKRNTKWGTAAIGKCAIAANNISKYFSDINSDVCLKLIAEMQNPDEYSLQSYLFSVSLQIQ